MFYEPITLRVLMDAYLRYGQDSLSGLSSSLPLFSVFASPLFSSFFFFFCFFFFSFARSTSRSSGELASSSRCSGMLWDLWGFTALWAYWFLTFFVRNLRADEVAFSPATYRTFTLCVAVFYWDLAIFVATVSWLIKIFFRDFFPDLRATTYRAAAIFQKISSSQLDQATPTYFHLHFHFCAAENRKIKGRPSLSPLAPAGRLSS